MTARIACAAAFAALSAAAAFVPGYSSGITREDILRRGLTNEQFLKFAAAKRTYSLTRSAVLENVFDAERGKNAVKWFEVVGETNDFAKVASVAVASNDLLKADNVSLTFTNMSLKAENAELSGDVARLSARVLNLESQVDYMVDENQRLEGRIELLEPRAKLADDVISSLRAERTLGPYLRASLVSEKSKTDDPAKLAVFDACIRLLDAESN